MGPEHMAVINVPSRMPTIVPKLKKDKTAALAKRKRSALIRSVPNDPPQRFIMASTKPSGGKIAKRAKTIEAIPKPVRMLPKKAIKSCCQ